MVRAVAVVALLVALATPVAAFAFSAQGTLAVSRWAASNRCAQAAAKQFPDYTAEANAKRDQAYQQCLESQNLPPRELPSGAKP